MLGADPTQLRELARSMATSKEQLDTAARELHGALSKARWQGPDSDRFRQRWATSLRPTLRSAGAGLADAAAMLAAQADEQLAASAADGGTTAGSPGAPANPASPANPGSSGAERNWSDAFTDPDYQHAPGGIEFALEKFLGGDGSNTSTMANAFKFVADKFGWNLSLADLETYMPKLDKAVKFGSRVLAGVGLVFGVLDIWSGLENQDPFRIADGGISALLSGAAIAATVTGVGAPVGIAIGAVALLWSGASLISGDVPLTKRMWDGGAALVGGVRDAASAVRDGIGWVSGRLGFG